MSGRPNYVCQIAILIVYVDDIVLTGDNKEEMDNLKRSLAKEFEIKHLGNLNTS